MTTILDDPRWRALYEREHDAGLSDQERVRASALRFVLEETDSISIREKRRRRYMAEAQQNGATLRDLADVAGLSPEGVRKMLAR